MRPTSALFLVLYFVLQGGTAMSQVPYPVTAYDDAITGTPNELSAVDEWARGAFLGEAPGGLIPITVRRHDFNVLRFRESCMETPLRIGERDYERGLGTHANSEIAVGVPEGAVRFEAEVGIDNNYDTAGARGSVQFCIEVGGVEVTRTATLTGDGEAVQVSVDVPAGTTEIVLKADTTPDGPGYDQCDWADARFVMADGKAKWLDEGHTVPFVAEDGVPFSFVYGGRPSAELLPSWQRSASTEDRDGRTVQTITWDDPDTGLRVSAEVTTFDRFPAVDWVLYFENRGQADTPIISDIQALDTILATGNSKRGATVHTLLGDVCGEATFTPTSKKLEVGERTTAAPTGGRPSNGAWPFMDIEYNGGGAIVAIGWSGQWAYSVERAPNGPANVRAGMELTRLTLHPGERIRSPRILLLPWKGDRLAAHNRLRRLLLFEYAPEVDGAPIKLPFVSQCFDRYSWSRPEWGTEAGQIAATEFAHAIGCDTQWLDAAWFPGGFPNGVGNMSAKPVEFPNGLRPVSDKCHELGMKFVLWFEPERVAPGTDIATQHPEFVHGGEAGGLYKLDDPAALKWIIDLLSQRVEEYGVDIFRTDFNIDPLPFWRAADAPDRQGMTEIRYVEGHYEMWDELLRRHPGLEIDNCASGGRRIDIETCSRSMPLWRSDTSCSPGHAEWNQAQSEGLSQYIPLFTACGWTPDPYEFRSSATGGAISQWDFLSPDFPLEPARATMAEAKANGPYWYGDFYPLTACGTALDNWAAYQFHRPDLDAGLVLAFRRAECPYPVIELALSGLSPDRTYKLELVNDAREVTELTRDGAELMKSFELRLPKHGSVVVRYGAE